MVINTNLPAMRAYTNLTVINGNVSSSMQRLSTGYRINSVKEDPAGLAISNKLRSQIRGLNVADRNSLDAISMIQTSEGALQEVHNMLHRIKELSVQASNGTNTPEDRDKMQQEVKDLLDEIDAIANRTEFNGMKLLNGDAARLSEVDDAANIKCTYISDNVDVGQLQYDIVSVGMPAVHVTNVSSFTPPLNGELSINGETVEFDNDSSESAVNKLIEMCARNNIEIAISNSGTWDDYINGTEQLMLYTKDSGSVQTIDIGGTLDVLTAFGFDIAMLSTKGEDAVISSNAKLDNDNLTVLADGNKIEFTGSDGRKIEIELQIKNAPEDDFSWKMADDSTDVTAYSKTGATVDILDFGTLKFQIGPDQYMELEVQIPTLTSKSLGINNINIASTQGAQRALDLVDKATDKLSSVRAKLGAYQNRLEYTSTSLTVASDNTSISLSRIYDTDMAEEMTKMTQNNIIAQAGIAILAQANQRPQQLLQLLN